MLMIGAVIGRMVGLATVDLAQGMGKRWSVGESGGSSGGTWPRRWSVGEWRAAGGEQEWRWHDRANSAEGYGLCFPSLPSTCRRHLLPHAPNQTCS